MIELSSDDHEYSLQTPPENPKISTAIRNPSSRVSWLSSVAYSWTVGFDILPVLAPSSRK